MAYGSRSSSNLRQRSASGSVQSQVESNGGGLSVTGCLADFSLYVFHPYGGGQKKTSLETLEKFESSYRRTPGKSECFLQLCLQSVYLLKRIQAKDIFIAQTCVECLKTAAANREFWSSLFGVKNKSEGRLSRNNVGKCFVLLQTHRQKTASVLRLRTWRARIR